MEFSGSVDLNASPDAIWAAMTDPKILSATIPYTKAVERLNDTNYVVHVSHRVGLINVNLKVALKIEEPNPPVSWRLKGKAKQPLVGGITAWADIRQEATATGSKLIYVAGGNLPGALQNMLGEGFDQKVINAINSFFLKLEEQIDGDVATI